MARMKHWIISLSILVLAGIASGAPAAVSSFDTGYTVMKVRSADVDGKPIMVGGSYEGTVLGVNYDGTVRWKNPLSGFMIHDIWCADITGDGSDEILVANADGAVYCLDAGGEELWQFTPNDGGHTPPMYAVCVIRAGRKTPYVVCGGFDMVSSGCAIPMAMACTRSCWARPRSVATR